MLATVAVGRAADAQDVAGLNVKERSDKLIGHTDHLLSYFLDLKEKLALLKPMIVDEYVQRRHGSGRKKRGFRIILHILFSDCAKGVVNLAWDKCKRTPSVTRIMSALQDEPTRKELGTRHASGQSQFDGLYQSICAQWREFEEQSWVDGLRILRDKVTAHYEVKNMRGRYVMIDASKLNLMLGDVERALEHMEPVVLGLNLLIRNSSFSMDSESRSSRKTAEGYWGSRSPS